MEHPYLVVGVVRGGLVRDGLEWGVYGGKGVYERGYIKVIPNEIYKYICYI